MSDTTTTPSSGRAMPTERWGVKRTIQALAFLLVFGASLFGPAGRLNWLNGWVFIGVYSFAALVAVIIVGRRDPELLSHRDRKQPNTKRWDKIWMAVYVPALFITLAVAGLDGGRFGWSAMSFGWPVVGVAILLLAFMVVTSAMLANTHFEIAARIQEDRGHQVVTSGPYQVVRHPGYVGAMLGVISVPLILGSWWAFAPGGLTVMLFIIRTALEDRMLQEELAGYNEYAQRVRYRLAPGVW